MSEIKKRPVELLVLGKIGVGKSSFINYILGLKEGDSAYCETGEAKRTTERGIFKKEGAIDGIPFNLYDSMGLEASNQDEQKRWIDMIRYFFNPEGRGRPAYQVDIPSRGFCHSVFYCLDSAVKVENNDIDKKMIKVISNDFKQQVTIILTKTDGTPKSTVDALEKELYKEFSKNRVYIIRATSISKEIEDSYGDIRKVRTSGVNQVRAEVLINFFNTLLEWLPDELIKKSVFNLLNKVDSNFKEIENIKRSCQDYIRFLKGEVENLDDDFSRRISRGEYDYNNQGKSNKALAEDLKEELKDILESKSYISSEINPLFEEFRTKIENIVREESEKINDNFKDSWDAWLKDLQGLIKMFNLDTLNADGVGLDLKEFKTKSTAKVIDAFNLQLSIKPRSRGFFKAIGDWFSSAFNFFTPDEGELRRIKNDAIDKAHKHIREVKNSFDNLIIKLKEDALSVCKEFKKNKDQISKATKNQVNKIIIDKEKIRENAKLKDGLKIKK